MDARRIKVVWGFIGGVIRKGLGFRGLGFKV
jgi:hypothetical protein